MSSKLSEHPRVVGLIVVAVIVLGGGLAFTYWPTTPPPLPETAEDVKALLNSKAYTQLTREQKRPYVQRVSELMRSGVGPSRRDLSDSEQARDNARDMMRQMMLDRARQFALADEATRQQMIEQDRKRMQAMRAARGQRGDRREGGPPGERGQERGERGDRPKPTEQEKQQRREEHESRVEQWVNEGNGQEWALMHEYMRQVRPQDGR